MIKNIIDTEQPEIKAGMLATMYDIANLVSTTTWEVGQAVYAAIMHAIKDRETRWQDRDKITQIRMSQTQLTMFVGGERQVKKGGPLTTERGGERRMLCRWYNMAQCRENSEYHTDQKTGITYRHCCLYCLKVDGRYNRHPEVECQAKKNTR